MYCNKCNTNWAALHSYNGADDIYDYCPNCYTDKYLEEKKEDEPAYIACKFSGALIDVKTGKKRQDEKITEPPPFEPYRWNTKYKFRQTIPRNH